MKTIIGYSVAYGLTISYIILTLYHYITISIGG